MHVMWIGKAEASFR